jgi:threonine-phosphate decarboxylase
MLGGHGGNIYETARLLDCAASEIIDMSSNINPLGPPRGLLDFLKKNMDAATRLPEIDSREIIHHFARHFDLAPDRLLAGNGTTQLIYMIPQILATRGALILGPTFTCYADACRVHDVLPALMKADESDDFRPDLGRLEREIDGKDTVFICNPNNPTGSLIPGDELERLCRSHPRTNFIIDESYLPFVNQGEKASLIQSELPNLVVLFSISKIFTIPGLRIGFVVSGTETIRKFKRFMQPWSVNSLAQAAGHYLTAQGTEVDLFIRNTQIFFEKQRKEFYKNFEHIPEIKLIPGVAPFVLIRLPDFLPAGRVSAQLARNKILIRDCSNFHGLSAQFIRVSLKTGQVNRTLAAKLVSVLQSSKNRNLMSGKRQTFGA